MCLAIPGRVVEINDENGLLMGKIDFSGSISNVCLSFCEGVQIGQYVIVHAGFAISVLDEESAKETLGYFDEMTKAANKDVKDIYDNPIN